MRLPSTRAPWNSFLTFSKDCAVGYARRTLAVADPEGRSLTLIWAICTWEMFSRTFFKFSWFTPKVRLNSINNLSEASEFVDITSWLPPCISSPKCCRCNLILVVKFRELLALFMPFAFSLCQSVPLWALPQPGLLFMSLWGLLFFIPFFLFLWETLVLLSIAPCASLNSTPTSLLLTSLPLTTLNPSLVCSTVFFRYANFFNLVHGNHSVY